jgi:hypothetical protein
MSPPVHPLKSPTIRGGSAGDPGATKVAVFPRITGVEVAAAVAATTQAAANTMRLTAAVCGAIRTNLALFLASMSKYVKRT